MRTLAPEGSYTSDNDNTYITTGNVKWNETDDFETKLEKIITQKWLGIYPNADELGQNAAVQDIRYSIL